jgi:hypothetical protein
MGTIPFITSVCFEKKPYPSPFHINWGRAASDAPAHGLIQIDPDPLAKMAAPLVPGAGGRTLVRGLLTFLD